MKRTSFCFLPFLFAILSPVGATVVLGVPGVQHNDNQNAATWYRRAADRMNSLSREDWDAINEYLDNPVGKPSPRTREALARSQSILDLVRRGARQPYSDFQHDYSEGFEMLLPHLRPLKRSAYLLRLDALVNLHDGDPAAAASSIATLSRLGGHMGEDRILISSLVGTAVFKAGDSVFQAMLDRGDLSPELALHLLQQSTALDSRDPFNYVEAIAMEQEIALSTIAKFESLPNDINDIALLTSPDDMTPELENYTRDDLNQDMERYDSMMTHLVEVFAEGDPEQGKAALAQLNKEIESGEHGLIAKLIMPSLAKVYDSMIDSRELLAARKELLRGIANGKINALKEANAAIWYLRAAELLEKRAPADLERLRNYDLDIAPPLAEELTTFFAEAADIFEILHEAMVMRQCDFSFTRLQNFGDQPDAPVLAPPYAIGLRDLFRLVTLDALRRLRSEDEEALADRLRIGFTMTVHLSMDPIFTSALTAHLGLNHLEALAASALDVKLLSPESQTRLHTIVHGMPRRDPCGYIASLVEARKQMTNYYNWVVPEDVSRQELQKRAKIVIDDFRGNQLLNLAAVLDTMRRAKPSDPDQQPPPSLSPLHDVYDLVALEQARERTPLLAPLLTAGDPEKLPAVLDKRTLPTIALIRRRMIDARRDLRRTLQLLKPKLGGHRPPSGTN